MVDGVDVAIADGLADVVGPGVRKPGAMTDAEVVWAINRIVAVYGRPGRAARMTVAGDGFVRVSAFVSGVRGERKLDGDAMDLGDAARVLLLSLSGWVGAERELLARAERERREAIG